MQTRFLLGLLCLIPLTIVSQDYFPENAGIKSENTNYHAFINATLHISPNQTVDKGTLLIKKGKIVAAGRSIAIPKNALIEDLEGYHMYPSLIDVFSNFGIEKPKSVNNEGRSPQYDPTREGYYWNDHIMPENNAVSVFNMDKKKAMELLKLGFGLVNSHLNDGIARGSGTLIALSPEAEASEYLIRDKSGQYFSFEKSVKSRQSYPTSLMGAMALLRQFFNDAKWYSQGNATTTDLSIEAYLEQQSSPILFDAGGNGNVTRAAKIARENGLEFIILGEGDEYQYIESLNKYNPKIVVPLNYPDPYDVSDANASTYINLSDMRHWNWAPSNAKILSDHNLDFVFTLYGLKSNNDFNDRIRKAIERGLSKEKALTALTTAPARYLGISSEYGTLEKGKAANFLITSKEIFDKDNEIFENWVKGKKYILKEKNTIPIEGKYSLTANKNTYDIAISGSVDKPSVEIKKDTLLLSSKIDYNGGWLTLRFKETNDVAPYRFSGKVFKKDQHIRGTLIGSDGQTYPEKHLLIKDSEYIENSEKEEKPTQNTEVELVGLTHPNVGYGYSSKPSQQNWLFTNATVWTGNEILENTDVLVTDGKIAKIGVGIKATNATRVDATGKHLTAGIIDEHSHIGALAINEAGQNSSAEVRMEDVIDPKDMDIYRNLAGGVTTIQLLHGSANPIGGQSAILRLKWGEDADGLLFKESPKFIKFALGENVKQSNWSSYSRFPQTRMGVEQVFVNYFQRAKDYNQNKLTGKIQRKDEELEVLSQILNGERYISCHSYVQSEINMLMKVAENFGFRVNTFTHILEGYKVADKMAAHGAGGSTFSDWWAYKYEVKDAIPYNAAIMASQGVTVAINSDDAEMSRRLNQEAAKTIKYGGMSEIEAWKTVTLNPAKLLHIDHKVGSVVVGKDADIVLWSGHPMSVYSRAEKTMIQGALYFDIELDKNQRNLIEKERNKLIGMMLEEKKNGSNTQPPVQKRKQRFECNTL